MHGRLRLHTVGDSHSLYPWSAVRLPWLEVVCHHLGARLMYSFGRDRGRLVDLRRLGVADGEAVVFCFGEIDARYHVGRYVAGGEAVIDVCNRLLRGYVEAVEEVTTGYGRLTVMLNALPPPRRYKAPSRFFWTGTDLERQTYFRTLNVGLRVVCATRGWWFVDAWKPTADADGFLRDDVSDRKTHVIDPAPLEAWLEANLRHQKDH